MSSKAGTAEVALASVRRLLTEYREATCVTDGAPCSWHRTAIEVANEIANEIDATIAHPRRWIAFPGNVPVCQDCGTDWQPVRRGECSACGSDAGPLAAHPDAPTTHDSAEAQESETR